MKLREDSNCCTLLWLQNFGEAQPENVPGGLFADNVCAENFEQFVERLQYKINAYNADKDVTNIGLMPFECRALICATTCSTQPVVEGYLKQFGFEQYGPYEKKKHDHTELSMWLMPIPLFVTTLREWDEKFGLNPYRTTPQKYWIGGELKWRWEQDVPAYLDGRVTKNG